MRANRYTPTINDSGQFSKLGNDLKKEMISKNALGKI